ncbi:MAG: hypothetical protein NTY45_00865 [Elusimicrobia bacterium]|nr:hypothetical protein [Elusimicrobiota bacterium]
MTMYATLTLSVSFFTAAVAAHLVICRATGTGRFMLKGLLTGFVCFACAAAWEYSAGAPDLVSLYLVLTLWLTYMVFFINLLNSVTLKMLARLAEEPSGTLTEAAFQDIFNEESAIKIRLQDMRVNGFIKLEGGNLGLTGKADALLKIVFLVRRAFSIDFVG